MMSVHEFQPGDEAAALSAINGSTGWDQFVFRKGVYRFSEPFVIRNEGILIAGWGATIENDGATFGNGIVFDLAGSHHRFEGLRIQTLTERDPLVSHVWRVNDPAGIGQCVIDSCIIQQNRRGPIFENLEGEVTELRILNSFARHKLDANRPGWWFKDSVAGTGKERKCSLVTFERYRHLYSGDYAVKVEVVDGGTANASTLSMRNINFEVCTGGAVHLRRVHQFNIEGVWFGDISPAQPDPFGRTLRNHAFRFEGDGTEGTVSTGKLAHAVLGGPPSVYDSEDIYDVWINSNDPAKRESQIVLHGVEVSNTRDDSSEELEPHEARVHYNGHAVLELGCNFTRRDEACSVTQWNEGDWST